MAVFASIELGVVAGYLVLMIAVGVLLARRNRGGEDFFAGGRAIPWWASGISLYMGNFSAWLFTGGAGMIYRTTGYGLVYFLLTGAVAYFIGSQISAARWRRTRVLSPVEFTRRRFGVVTQQVLGLITALVYLAAAGNQLKALSTIVETMLGVPLATAAVAIGVIVIFYTLLGGLWAVVVTDVLQFVVLLAVSLVIVPLVVALVDGGIGTILGTIAFTIPPVGGDPDHDLHFLIAYLLLLVIGVGGGQGPRFYCVPDERDARKAGALAAALFLTTPVLFAIPPLAARALWGGPDVLGQTIAGPNPHEQVFVVLALEVLPPGLAGVFVAAMFAATMSALSTVYNMVASVLSRDVYPVFRKKVSDRELLTVGRVMTLVIGLVTIGLCLWYVAARKDLFKIMIEIMALSGPVMNVPMLMGLFARRAPRAAALATIAGGVATALVTKLALGWPAGPRIYLTHAACLAIFFGAAWLGRTWRRRCGPLAVVGVAIGTAGALLALMLWLTPNFPGGLPLGAAVAALAYPLVMAALLVGFARKFSRPEDHSEVDRFYRNLDTPVNVAAEVTGSAGSVLGVYRLVGGLTLLMALLTLGLMALELAAPPAAGAQPGKYLLLAAILLLLAGFFRLLARRARGTPGTDTHAPEPHV
ncbi:MAG: hypothetical protein JXQ29_00600 [Planctomycetes bacterium]|nr:hypothetical protein [Planctomycetota bacterium]